MNFFISGTFHEWWQTYHERWLDWNRRSIFSSKSKSQIWKRMMEFFIISVNKQLPAIRNIFGAKNQKFKSQKFKETERFSWVVTKFSWVMTRASSNFSVAQTCHEWWQILSWVVTRGLGTFSGWFQTALFALNALPTALFLWEDINTTLKSVGGNQWSWANTIRAKILSY